MRLQINTNLNCDTAPVIEEHIEDWARVISLRTGCNVYVPATRQTLYGMYSTPLNGTLDLNNFSYYPPLISNLTEKIKKSNINVQISKNKYLWR